MLPVALPALASAVCASSSTSRCGGLRPVPKSASPEVRTKQVEHEKVIPPWRRRTLHRPGVAQPIFFESFAGDGHLSIAMREMGFEVCADDLLFGGTDFLDDGAVEEAKSRIQIAAAEGKPVAVHLAPPCATFSRARDRSKRTRLRSTARPRGLERRPRSGGKRGSRSRVRTGQLGSQEMRRVGYPRKPTDQLHVGRLRGDGRRFR